MNPTVSSILALGKAALPFVAPQFGASAAVVTAVVDLFDEVKATTDLSPDDVARLNAGRAEFEAGVLAEGRALSDRLAG